MSSGRYPEGTVVLTTLDVEGIVIPNFKLPGDICVEWESGQKISYDEEFLDSIVVERRIPAGYVANILSQIIALQEAKEED